MLNSSSNAAKPGASIVRWVAYSHLAAVIVCASFSLADTGLLVNSSVSRIFYDKAGILLLPSVLAWFVCPAVLVVSFSRGLVSARAGSIGVAAEILLFIAQMYALLPACQ